MSLPLTAALLARNEADRLPATLAALAGHVERIVVLDSGSADGTPDVARAAGAEVVEEPWAGYVAARQRLLELCASDWVLMIDADEVLAPALWDELRGRGFPEAGVDGYALRRRTHYMGRTLRFAWQPDWKLALVRRAAVRVVGGSVHERLHVPGRVVRLRAGITHHSYRSLGDHMARIQRYAELAAQDLHARGRHAHWWDLSLRPAWHVLRMAVLKGALLDGWRGWLAAASAGINAYVRYARLAELWAMGRGAERDVSRDAP